MRALWVAGSVLLSLAFAARAHAQGHAAGKSPVAIKVTLGYGGRYRGNPAWAPVRVTLRNGGGRTFAGTVEIPDATASEPPGASTPAPVYYQMRVTLPAHTTKRVTLYVPGADIQGDVGAVFRADGRTLAAGTAFAVTLDDRELSIGAVTANPLDVNWLRRASPHGVPAFVFTLDPSTLDPVPYALASFDLIVLNNTVSAGLSHDQWAALERYVRNGGALLEIGGPDWQETLDSLPAALSPGMIAGVRHLSDLHGLARLGGGVPPRGPVTVSVLRGAEGTTLSAQAGVPLMTDRVLGSGQIFYLAFDPGLSPFPHWRHASSFLAQIVRSSATSGMSRTGEAETYGTTSFLNPGGEALDLATELSNLPSAKMPSVLFFLILTAGYVVLIGPVNFLFLRRAGRPALSWVTVPLLAGGCVLCTHQLAGYFKASTTMINAVSVVELDGQDGGLYPASRYVALFTPVHGTYHLSYGSPALVSPVPGSTFGVPGQGAALWRVQQGTQTGVDFAAMGTWSTRSILLRTTVPIAGRLQADLYLNRQGAIVGVVRNETALHILHPALVAGTAFQRLPDLGPGASARVTLRPAYAGQGDDEQMLLKLYGHVSSSLPFSSTAGWTGNLVPSGAVSWATSSSLATASVVVVSSQSCCPADSAPREATLSDRIRNAANMLPQTHDLSALSEVSLVGWTEDPLGAFSVNGSSPIRRELTLLADPVAVAIPRGPFHLSSGVLGAQLVDDAPGPPGSADTSAVEPVHVAEGGSATFQFTIPDGGRVHFTHLRLHTYGGMSGLSATDAIADGEVRVYDWQAARWVLVKLNGYGAGDLLAPDRFISASGALLVRIHAIHGGGEILIPDAHRDLQLTGDGTVR